MFFAIYVDISSLARPPTKDIKHSVFYILCRSPDRLTGWHSPGVSSSCFRRSTSGFGVGDLCSTIGVTHHRHHQSSHRSWLCWLFTEIRSRSVEIWNIPLVVLWWCRYMLCSGPYVGLSTVELELVAGGWVRRAEQTRWCHLHPPGWCCGVWSVSRSTSSIYNIN